MCGAGRSVATPCPTAATGPSDLASARRRNWWPVAWALTAPNHWGMDGTVTMTTDDDSGRPIAAGERADLLASLRAHRHFLRYTLRDLDDEQAAQATTVSSLCLGGLVKHLTRVERVWMDFVSGRPRSDEPDAGMGEHQRSFEMLPGETLADLLAAYAARAAATDEILTTVDDLDADRPLPATPWREPGARWSNRRVFLHIIAETAQHAGHADIIRESLDGAKTMG